MTYPNLGSTPDILSANIPDYAKKVSIESGVYIAVGLCAIAMIIIISKKRKKGGK